MDNRIIELKRELGQMENDKIRQSAERFFKEEIHCYGIKAAQVRILAKKYFKLLGKSDKKDIFNLCEKLWQSGMFEECVIALEWSFYLKKQYEEGDFKIFETWIEKYITNWATCDGFCNHSVGEFLMKYPQYLKELKRWARSENRWIRRAAAVSLIVPARKGMFLKEIFEIALIMLSDKDDMVQKGYGWSLKVASQVYPDDVFAFVMHHKNKMPRTALRYAIEKMPQERRMQAMGK